MEELGINGTSGEGTDVNNAGISSSREITIEASRGINGSIEFKTGHQKCWNQ
jgi:hypothetical protein